MPTFALPQLPYAMDALAPYISQETLEYHYGKHHTTYLNKLNELLVQTPSTERTLEGLIRSTSGTLFNQAAQVWNHTFYWECLQPPQGQQPSETLRARIEAQFGTLEDFKAQFNAAAQALFGSGWVWLTLTQDQTLTLRSTRNADTPLTDHETPLLTCDVWEHAYYIDTRNQRPQYLENFWTLVNWDFVEQQYTQPYTFPKPTE
ncbi:MAG: superoxide dismutase [Fe] [Legionellales bacterium]|nr:superoxide dismutase [Fe] [Legionellales bacterium]|tara:strand:+ start:62 stop:673 length:612 start_codon:yes stop_codon:yes gene_type:complete